MRRGKSDNIHSDEIHTKTEWVLIVVLGIVMVVLIWAAVFTGATAPV